MANIYYVKSGGTATGDGGMVADASMRTSTWSATASEYYDNIWDVLAGSGGVPTTDFTAADRIFVSDAHNKDHGTNRTYVFPSAIIPSQIITVSDSNQAVESAGAVEGNAGTGSTSVIINNLFISTGLSWSTQSNMQFTTVAAGIVRKGAIKLESSADRILMSGDDGISLQLYESDINYGFTNNYIYMSYGALFEWVGGAITGSDGDNLFDTAWLSGGARASIVGVDLSKITKGASAAHILGGAGSSTAEDMIYCRLEGCKVSAESGFSFVEEEFVRPSMVFLATQCGSTSAEAEYQFFQRTWGGDVEDEISIIRTGSTAFPSGQKVSMKVTPVSGCTPQRDVVFDLPAQFVALSGSGSTDIVRIYLAVSSAVTLTDQDVWAELIYPDGTNQHTFNYLSSRNTDILAAGTTLTADAVSVWDNLTENAYQIDLDSGVDVGADCVPIIRIHVGGDFSATPIYFDTTVGVTG